MVRQYMLSELEGENMKTPSGQCDKFAIDEHVINQPITHEVDWSTLRVIYRPRGKGERKIRESLHIHLRHPKVNRDNVVERSAV